MLIIIVMLGEGVDLSNQMIASYNNTHKSIKWYKTLALSFMETSIVNSYQIYKLRNPRSPKTHLKFREDLVIDLIEDYIDEKAQQQMNQPTQRLISGLYHIGKRSQRRCRVCSTDESKKTTVFYGLECDENVLCN